MPKRKKNDANAEKDIDKKADLDEAQSQDPSTLSDKDSISKGTPNLSNKNDHRFHKVVNGKDKATKVLYKKRSESRDEAVNRLKETGWIDDNIQHHFGPNGNEIHEGDPSKCPNCARYAKKNSTKSSSDEPKLSSQPLNTVEDVEKAWTTIPANTVPYFEFNYYNDNLVVPLISKPVSVNRALAMFKKATWFSHEKPELKARILGKAESHECPGALQVKVRLVGDMLKVLNKLDIRGWTSVLLGAKEDFNEKRVTLKPRIECVYTPQVIKPEVLDTLKEPFGLKEDEFKPKEDEKGNDTTDESDK
jgi:hypothetical protein